METVAFGYHARALWFLNSGSNGPLAIRDMRRQFTAGDGLADPIIGEHVRSGFVNGRSDSSGEPGTSTEEKP